VNAAELLASRIIDVGASNLARGDKLSVASFEVLKGCRLSSSLFRPGASIGATLEDGSGDGPNQVALTL
jgi:hypothetical protein